MLAPFQAEILPNWIEFRSLVWKDDRGRRGGIKLAPACVWAIPTGCNDSALSDLAGFRR